MFNQPTNVFKIPSKSTLSYGLIFSFISSNNLLNSPLCSWVASYIIKVSSILSSIHLPYLEYI